MIDYELLRVIWWALLGVLLIGFAIMDGFDLGAAICLPWMGKTDLERRVIINCVGPTWEGNQVWFILGGGAIFAAWPALYGLSFSGFYLAMLVVLLSLILRPVGFKYRSKLDNSTWRNVWDWLLFVGGFVPALIFGVAVGNVLQGVPFYFDENLRAFYTGSFWGLLNPFALATGLLSVLMLTLHGAAFLNTKTEGHVQLRAKKVMKIFGVLTGLVFVLLGVWVYIGVDGYTVLHPIAHDGPSNPLYKEVRILPKAWYLNYTQYPLLLIVPGLGILGAWVAAFISRIEKLAFCVSALSIAGIISTVGVSMFPFILPSTTNPSHSLLVWDSSSSELTLMIMLISTVIFLPIILAYTAWVYRVLKGKVTIDTILKNDDIAY